MISISERTYHNLAQMGTLGPSLGLGKHMIENVTGSVNQPDGNSEIGISERGNIPNNDLPYSQDPSNPTHPTLTLYSCYHCEGFHTDSQNDYERHMAKKHFKLPAYPSMADLQRHGLKAQGKDWEK